MRPLKTLSLRFAALALAAWVAAMDAASAQDNARKYQIAEQSLGQALREFAVASNLDLLFSPDLVAGKTSQLLDGKFTVDEGLRALLRGSGLEFSVSGSRVVISQAKPASTRQAIAPTTSATSGPNGYTRLTQAESDLSQSSSSKPSVARAGDSRQERIELEEIIVTGSHIRGATPASPVLTVTRQDIDRSGYSTTSDVVRSLPQSFAGGQNPGITGALGIASSNNFGDAASADLRGLGPGATLTLVNGHRLAYNGIYNATDISAIPLAAVERIEIMTDGGSALYGSDAIAGVVNFILRTNYDGAETAARIGDSTGGGGSEMQFSQLLGHTWSSGNALINYEYQNNKELSSSERDFSAALPDPNTLLPAQERNSVFISLGQALTSTVDAFVEGLYTDRTTEKEMTIFGFSSSLDADVTQYGGTGGLRARLPVSWRAELSATRATDDEHFAQVSGPAAVRFDIRNDLTSIDGLAEGPVLNLPTGDLSVALGAGFRREELDALYETRQGGERDTRYAFVEISIPVIGSGAAILEASVSGRYEDYSDFGDVFNPKLGLVYRATSDLKLRGTWGESFRAPPLLQVDGTRSLFAYPAQALAIPGASPTATALLRGGANQELQPETSRSWTVGFDYAPDWAAGFGLNATYFEIDYADRIIVPLASIGGIFDNPAFAPFIIKNPDLAAINAMIAETNRFQSLLAGPFDPGSVVAIYLTQYHNAQSQTVRGADLGAHYRWDTRVGAFTAALNGSWLDLVQRDLQALPERQISGTIFNPPEWKARGTLTWQRGDFTATGAVNYVGSEIDNSAGAVPWAVGAGERIGSWTTVDAQLSYQTDESVRIWGGTRISLAVQNVFDEGPPRTAATSAVLIGLGYDSANASPLGRFVSLTVGRRW